MRHWLLIPAVSLIPFVAAPTVHAATKKPKTENDCVLNSSNGDGAQGLDHGSSAESGDSLTDTLGSCNSVLKPPPVNDRELTIRPPVTGDTPVIPPRALPKQPPQDDASELAPH